MFKRFGAWWRRFGHPLHPVFVHFPTALFPTSFLFDIISLRLASRALVEAAAYTMAIGEGTGFLAAATGAIDYLTRVVPGTAAFRVATFHALLNAGVLVLYGFNLGLRLGPALEASRTPLRLVLLSLAGVLLLTVGNHLGGRLVYHFGVGVRLSGRSVS